VLSIIIKPIILTINGKAEVVLQDATAFQEMTERLQQVELCTML
jgi:hypothetical protein